MANKKLQEMGSRLGISEEDIAAIRKERIKRRLRHLLMGAIIALGGLGLLVATANSAKSAAYPYAAPGLGLIAGAKRKKGVFVLVAVLLSIIVAMATCKGDCGPVPEYNVFSRQK